MHFMFNIKTVISLAIMLSWISIVGDAGAADSSKNGNLRIISTPRNVAVTLDGENRISTVAPCLLRSSISGYHKVKASKPGYENWESRILIQPDQESVLNIELKPKTRFKSMIRSTIIPGWGQFYSGRKLKGAILGIATVGCAAVTLAVLEDYNNKDHDYRVARGIFLNAGSVERKEELLPTLNDRREEAYDAETALRTLTIITAGLWAYNIIDSALFFPSYQGGELSGIRTSIQTSVVGENPGIIISMKF
ncbi:MAG: PEGA domain-containing protein [candidate division Zixibacteria bacterium]|nr:PEGA domain-containing protein [candidate division Zixibacteria bacterium]